jgi:hypothetical protein
VARSDGRLLHMSLRSGEFRVALMPPRRRVWFLLGGAVSSSILRGDSETERLLEGRRFLPWLQHSPSQIYIRGFQPVKRYTNYFGVWTLSGLRMWFVARNKRGGWLSLRWLWTTN